MAENERTRDERPERRRTDREQRLRERARAAYDMAVREAAIMQHIDARRLVPPRRDQATAAESR
jgi:hypothetical protein